ncbi:MAG: hypothetical protein Q4B26_11950 [Eubacteriales bacterium]|nr:hypothetical protein [Eubacteriales bacterium]
MWLSVNEDDYWERRREEWENQRAFRRRSEWDEEEKETEREYLFLDEEEDEIEEKLGYPMNELCEGDLLDIVEDMKGIEAESAEWDGNSHAIVYTYEVA